MLISGFFLVVIRALLGRYQGVIMALFSDVCYLFAVTLLLFCCYFAVILPLFCCYFAVILLLFCCYSAVILLLSCCYFAVLSVILLFLLFWENPELFAPRPRPAKLYIYRRGEICLGVGVWEKSSTSSGFFPKQQKQQNNRKNGKITAE